ncbi:FAD-binding oxidoreductase [Pseudoruegeria sp. HB172150]|uniref:NAD(P)/FAD-dependent oxidoreductase n=1 Tax=Pseudoruegeria sp. HB172150 TaxID=2721164 RepID=UPI0015557FDB|nr:FAD-binding oxidoreductase [Pseudoruegeria sp. HB172150]
MQFPIHIATPVAHPGPHPDSADVVVIGAGVAGVSAALFLNRRGLKVVLLEKGRVAGEQSSRNWGWIRQQGRDPDELPIMVEARRLWLQLAEESGEDMGLAPGGVTYLATSDKEMAQFEDWIQYARANDVDSHMMTTAEVDDLVPGMATRYKGALRTPSDMRGEPWLAVPALARLAAREGVTVVEHCAARTLDISGGKVAGVVTEQGRIAAPQVLLTGGAWSSLFLRAHGVAMPQLSVRATVAATEQLPTVHEGGVADDKIAFRRRNDGGYSIAAGGFHDLYIGPDAFRNVFKYLHVLGEHPFSTRYHLKSPAAYPDAWGTPRRWDGDRESPFERMRILNPAPSKVALKKFTGGFSRLFPEFGEIRLRTAWAGMIDLMPDTVPVLDRAEALPGLWIGTGLSGHGFGIGPGIGRVLADLIAGNAPGHDLTRFRLARFSDGTPIRPGPAL